jgi:hypothetical protein
VKLPSSDLFYFLQLPWAIGRYGPWSGILPCVPSPCNIGLYLLVSAKQSLDHDPATRRYQRRMRLLAAPMVAVCAWRCFFPNLYPGRITWYDSLMCSILLHRMIATVAEVCWIAQIASALSFIGKGISHAQASCPSGSVTSSSRINYIGNLTKLAVGAIFAAEMCSDFATITNDYMGFFLEESLWAIAFLIFCPISIFLMHALRRLPADMNKANGCCSAGAFLLMTSCLTSGYLIWQMFFHVPGEYNTWRNQLATGTATDPFLKGLWSSLVERHVSRAFNVWGSGLLWLTGYFSIGVWSSIALVCSPRISLQPLAQMDAA